MTDVDLSDFAGQVTLTVEQFHGSCLYRIYIVNGSLENNYLEGDVMNVF